MAFGCLSFLIQICLPRNDVSQLVNVLFIPMSAALFRSAIGWGQISRTCDGVAPWGRQTALGAGIILLLLFQIAFGVIMAARGAVPVGVWLFCAVTYTAYLFAIAVALRPRVVELPD
jgi:hypothetical protein